MGDISSIFLKIFRCNRIAIGPFERGPVTGMTESHNRMVPPPQCIDFNPDIGDIDVLIALWLDDKEIAGYLNSMYGMPVRVAHFDYTVDTTVPVEQRKWTWSSEGSASSELVLPFVKGTDNSSASFSRRMAWHNQTAVSVMDHRTVSPVESDHNFPATYGLMRAPMMQARSGIEAYAGRGDVWRYGHITQTIYRFADMNCEKRLQ